MKAKRTLSARKHLINAWIFSLSGCVELGPPDVWVMIPSNQPLILSQLTKLLSGPDLVTRALARSRDSSWAIVHEQHKNTLLHYFALYLKLSSLLSYGFASIHHSLLSVFSPSVYDLFLFTFLENSS